MELDSGSEKNIDIAIIGAGPAAYFSAINCAESGFGKKFQIQIFEKQKTVLNKVKVSGGGRCNVTTSTLNPVDLVHFYPRGKKELLGPFNYWGPKDTANWFESKGVRLQTEKDGRVFPYSNDSQTIIDCLSKEIKRLGVNVVHGTTIIKLSKREEDFELHLSCGKVVRAKKVLVAAGSLSTSNLVTEIKALGHKVTPLVPSLFSFKIKDALLTDLQGLSVLDMEVTAVGSKFKERGPSVVTHWGMSGPAILKLSSRGALWFHKKEYRFNVIINWVPSINKEQVKEQLIKVVKSDDGRKLKNLSQFGIPSRLWEGLLLRAGLVPDDPGRGLSIKSIASLADVLNRTAFSVEGKSTNKEEFVTCGGVSLKEVNFKTMESKLVSGLYFAGESLNIDALTGGYNFQAAWTTGRIAGKALAESIKEGIKS